MKQPIKISASRVKCLKDCSMLFYLQEIERLPQKVWPRTNHGTLIHNIFEMIMDKKRAKRRLWLKDIILNGFDIQKYPSIKRYIHLFNNRIASLEPYTIKEMSDMLSVAFFGIRKYFLDDTGEKFILPEYTNEERFQIDLGTFTISGFIDLKIKLSNDKFIILDLKSQRNKFKKDEMIDNIQGLMYELAVWEKYKAQSHVEFILLRHAPTKKNPNLHIQITPEATPAQLIGLKLYLSHLYAEVNNFGMKEAISHPHEDKFFCRNVCSYFKAFDYKSVRKKSDNSLVRNYSLDSSPEIGQDEYEEKRHYDGCPVADRT